MAEEGVGLSGADHRQYLQWSRTFVFTHIGSIAMPKNVGALNMLWKRLNSFRYHVTDLFIPITLGLEKSMGCIFESAITCGVHDWCVGTTLHGANLKGSTLF